MAGPRTRTTAPAYSNHTYPETASLAVAIEALTSAILAGRLITGRALEATIEAAYGAPASSGAWDWRTAYDLLEGAAARAHLETGPRTLADLLAAERLRPTQTRRSEDQVRLQQFSTPLPYAAVAAGAAALTPDDLVLEPSAGCGALAALARSFGARVLLNEWDPRRRAILEIVFGQRVFGHDGAIIDDALGAATAPTAVLMNPPFSSSFDRRSDPNVAGRHLLSALKRLAPGGRLVAIMPTSFSPDRPKSFWGVFAGLARVHLAMTAPGSVYRKNGTGVETRLIVANRTGGGIEAGDEVCRFGASEAEDDASALRALEAVIAEAVPPRVEAPAEATSRTARPAAPARATSSASTPRPRRAGGPAPAPRHLRSPPTVGRRLRRSPTVGRLWRPPLCRWLTPSWPSRA